MATQGPFFWIDYALKKIGDGTLDLNTQTLKAVLLDNSQVVSRSFTGMSGNAQYSDLTGELSTLNGYTSGGLTLNNAALNRPSSSKVVFKTDPFSWSLTGSLIFKYVAIYAFGATNKDLLMVADMDTGGGTVTATGSILTFTPDGTNGWGYWNQP